MDARKTNIQDILGGNKQYLVPLFQRTYDWKRENWETLWNDLIELYESDEPTSHFFGSFVNSSYGVVSVGVPQLLVIDGQQRLTTLSILLILLRNKAKEEGNADLAEEIHYSFLVNQFNKGDEFFKLMPTKADLTTYQNLIQNEETKTEEDNNIHKAYKYFEQQLKKKPLDLRKLLQRMTGLLSVVVIQLADEDNPFLVFEGLNFKGKQLSEADLIRNYIFMQLDKSDRDAVYAQYWLPMQERLVQVVQNRREDRMTDFIWHNLMRRGNEVKTSAVYTELKKSLKEERISTKDYVKELEVFSHYYEKLIYPEKESDHEIRACLKRLNRLGFTVIYPFLLSLYQKYTAKKVTKSDFIESLKTIENFLIRRFICRYPSNRLTKIFLSVPSEIEKNFPMISYKDSESVLVTIRRKNVIPRTMNSAMKFKVFRFTADRKSMQEQN